MLTRYLLFCLFFMPFLIQAQELPLLRVSDDKKYLVTADNEPFFWLGGTAWELIHRLSKEEIDLYLTDRAEKGFTVIQTVVLAELDGLNEPNYYGERPLVEHDPTRLNEKYFELVDYVLSRSEELGLYVGLLPTWGDKFNQKWGKGPVIFNPQNAEIYGKLLAQRYNSHSNLIWILGGDRLPEKEEHYEIIRAMAKGIREFDSNHLITYHPVGGSIASDFFPEQWLDFDMFQSGHNSLAQEYTYVFKSRNQVPDKPVVNGEARYENIGDRFWDEEKHGWLDEADVRVSAYWSMLAGAAGYTYGCNDIWQMFDLTNEPVIQARTGWKAALDLPGSTQMGFMRSLFERFPWQSMSYDSTLIQAENPDDGSHIIAALGKEKDFLLAYTPLGKSIHLDGSRLSSPTVYAYWFNPRSGGIRYVGEFKPTSSLSFKPWADGRGSDFVLILSNKRINE